MGRDRAAARFAGGEPHIVDDVVGDAVDPCEGDRDQADEAYEPGLRRYREAHGRVGTRPVR
jgi:hypothetical protein